MKGLSRSLANCQGANRISNQTSRIGVGDTNRRTQQPLFGKPGHARHLAAAIEAVHTCKTILTPKLGAPRPHRCHTGAHHVWGVLHQAGIAHPYARHVGDGVPETGGQRAGGDTQITQAFGGQRLNHGPILVAGQAPS